MNGIFQVVPKGVTEFLLPVTTWLPVNEKPKPIPGKLIFLKVRGGDVYIVYYHETPTKGKEGFVSSMYSPAVVEKGRAIVKNKSFSFTKEVLATSTWIPCGFDFKIEFPV